MRGHLLGQAISNLDMGCGSSADQPTAVVPAAGATGAAAARGGGGAAGAQPQQKAPPPLILTLTVSPTHQSQPSHSSLQPQQPQQLPPQHQQTASLSVAAVQSGGSLPPPGLASSRNNSQLSPRGGDHARQGSRRLSAGEDDLPPLKSPRKRLSSASATQSAAAMVPTVSPENAPPGSQIAGLNYCSADYFPTHMEQTWNHYARPPDYQLLDKSGLKLLAEDALASFSDASRTYLAKENPKWLEAKLDSKLQALRTQYIPGAKIEDSIVIATHYLAHELKFAAGDGDGKNSGVTKPCFFLHFQRAHRLLFSYTGGQDISLERELLVQRLNKQGVERASKALRSLTLTAPSSGSSSATTLSSKAAKASAKAAARRKSRRDSAPRPSKVGQASDTNMFAHIDFSSPAKNKEVAVSEEETVQAAAQLSTSNQ